jgi:cyanophycinase-like exopeptidase
MDYIKVIFSVLLAIGMLCAPLLAGRALAEAEPGYDYFIIGNEENVEPVTIPGLLLMGGSTDVDDGFRWLIDKSGGGDFLVIRASGTDAYNPYIYGELGKTVDSAATLILKKERAAYDPFVINTILQAEALFIAGGNQWDYVRDWKGTPVEDAIHQLAARSVPIGGTSAGLAVMGEFVFSAEHETITSQQALKNPYHPSAALATDFLELPHLNGVITDSHFVPRDRMGRLVTFMARILNDGWAGEVKAIGVNERTALAVEGDGSATLFGEGPVYFLKSTTYPEVCEKSTPLTFRDVQVYRIGKDGSFNLNSWEGQNGMAYELSAVEGELISSQPDGAIY